MVYIIINLNSENKGNFLIADLNPIENKKKALFSSELKSTKWLPIFLLMAYKHKAEGYIIMFGNESETEIFKGGFNILKHTKTIYKALDRIQDKVIKTPLKNELKNLSEQFKEVKIEEILNTLMDILKRYFPSLERVTDDLPKETDRDYLDLSIEVYKLLYSIAYDMSYMGNKIDNVIIKDKFMKMLLLYKADNYGEEILKYYNL